MMICYEHDYEQNRLVEVGCPGEPVELRPGADMTSEALTGDGPCSDCGTDENPVWFTDSVFWNEIIRKENFVEPILCINCFVVRVDEAGFAPTGWRLSPDWHWATKTEQQSRAGANSEKYRTDLTRD